MATFLGRSPAEVRDFCNRNSIEFKRTRQRVLLRVWHPDEKEWLQENSLKYTVTELAERFETSRNTMRTYLRRHDFKFKLEKHPWTKRDTYTLLTYVERYNRDQIAKKMNKPVGTIHNQMTKNELHSYAAYFTQGRIVEETGYDEDQLKEAKVALNQLWKWTGKRYLISQEQYDELMAYFRGEIGEAA